MEINKQVLTPKKLHQLAQFWITGKSFMLTPYQARHRAIGYVSRKTPLFEIHQAVILDTEQITPEIRIDHETIRDIHGRCKVEINHPVILHPDYEVVASNSEAGYSKQLMIHGTR